MLYTKLDSLRKEQTGVHTFGGLQVRPDVPDGSWFDEKNLTTDEYPRMTVRKGRVLCGELDGNNIECGVLAAVGTDRMIVLDRYGSLHAGGHSVLLLDGPLAVRQDNPYVTVTDPDRTIGMFGDGPGVHILTMRRDEGRPDGWYEDGWSNHADEDLHNIGMDIQPGIRIPTGSQLTVEIYRDFSPGAGEVRRQLTAMGAYVILMPDKLYCNAVKLAAGDAMVEGEDYGEIERHYISKCEDTGDGPDPNVTIIPCTADGTDAPNGYVSGEPPASPQGGDIWVDTSDMSGIVYKRWDAGTETWVAIPTTYLKVKAEGIGEGLAEGDVVDIKLSHIQGLQDDAPAIAVTGTHALVAVHHDAYHPENDYIVFIGIIENQNTQVACWLTVDRSLPELDFIVECQNRLWGCHYGKDENGQILNEIYGSKLGDFKNWRAYEGLATDSYTASRGSDGPYTGAAVLDGHPLFFKESCVEKVFPSPTGAHQIMTTTLDGVEQGSDRSLVVIDNVLYYKARDAVVRYTGTMPQIVSEPLGNDEYTDGIAGRHGKKYCIVMQNRKTGAWAMYVWDTLRGIWHREDKEYVPDLIAVTWKDRLYLTDVRGRLWQQDGTDDCRGVEWYAETGEIGLNIARRKFISRLQLRVRLELGATARVYISYDGGPWLRKALLHGNALHPQLVPITPRRCDRLRLRLEGVGGCELESIVYQVRTGSMKE